MQTNDRQTTTTDKASTWMGTLNNPDIPPQDFLQQLWDSGKFNYVCGQLERGESGTPHVQFYVNAGSSQIRFAALKKLSPTCHWEPVRFNKAAQQYVMKEDTRVEGPWEFGQAPKINQSADSVAKAREARARLNDEIHSLGPLESMRQGLISYKDYKAVKQARDMIELDQQQPQNMAHERGIWIQGEPRVGKSWIARNAWGAFYLKAQNKWWDGYSGQDTVIIEDMDEQGDKLGHLLKLWADSYSLTGEVKGGTVPLNFKRLIVTSNYSIQHIFGADPDQPLTVKQRTSKEQMCKAISARFAQIFVYDRSDQQSILNDPDHFKPGQVYHMNAIKLLKPAKLSEQRESISPEHLILHQVGVQGSPGFEVTKLILIPQPDTRLNPTNTAAQSILGKRPAYSGRQSPAELIPALKQTLEQSRSAEPDPALKQLQSVEPQKDEATVDLIDVTVDINMLQLEDSVEVSEGDLE